MEDREQGLKRRKAGYGLTTEEPFRIQPHGAEYRVCSSFLVTPHITNAFSCLFKVVMFEYLNNKSFNFRAYDYGNDFFRMNVDKLRAHIPAIWQDIQKMQLYPKFKCYIDLIYNLVSNKKGWTPKKIGVKEAWGIINHREPAPKVQHYKFKSISLDAIWKDSGVAKDALNYPSTPKFNYKAVSNY